MVKVLKDDMGFCVPMCVHERLLVFLGKGHAEELAGAFLADSAGLPLAVGAADRDHLLEEVFEQVFKAFLYGVGETGLLGEKRKGLDGFNKGKF